MSVKSPDENQNTALEIYHGPDELLQENSLLHKLQKARNNLWLVEDRIDCVDTHSFGGLFDFFTCASSLFLRLYGCMHIHIQQKI